MNGVFQSLVTLLASHHVALKEMIKVILFYLLLTYSIFSVFNIQTFFFVLVFFLLNDFCPPQSMSDYVEDWGMGAHSLGRLVIRKERQDQDLSHFLGCEQFFLFLLSLQCTSLKFFLPLAIHPWSSFFPFEELLSSLFNIYVWHVLLSVLLFSLVSLINLTAGFPPMSFENYDHVQLFVKLIEAKDSNSPVLDLGKTKALGEKIE